jgi:3'-phosphoadenosine 5'-phosphosulfate sulfotransferase (PAPS reductase)/FAD synthetase
MMTLDQKTRWCLRSKTTEYRRRLGYAVDSIALAVKQTTPCVSWSGGKDSTAMAHLVCTTFRNTKVLVQVDDCDWPEKLPYVSRLADLYGWDVHIIRPDFSVWDFMCSGSIGHEDFCSASHDLTKSSFLYPLKQAQSALGCNCVFIGLRAAESKARGVHLSVRKELYRKKGGDYVCCPLARWDAVDVFSYLVSNGIEVNPCYFQNRFMQPEEIRLSWAVPTPKGLTNGAMEHMRYYYPKHFSKLRDMGVC